MCETCGVAPVEVEDNGEETIEVSDEPERAPIRTAPSPVKPTAAEVEDHRLTHYPFRSWCSVCMEAKALGEQRGHAPKADNEEVPRVGMDYFFMTEKGEFYKRRDLVELGYPFDDAGEARLEEARRNKVIVKCIMMRCRKTKAVGAHVVPVKGIDEHGHVVDLVVNFLSWLGHTRLMLKTDNEPAILKVLRTAVVSMRVKCDNLDTIADEHPPAYDS